MTNTDISAARIAKLAPAPILPNPLAIPSTIRALAQPTCIKSGRPVPALPTDELSLMYETLGPFATTERLRDTKRTAVHSLWLRTDSTALTQNGKLDPSGLCVYLAGLLSPITTAARASIWQNLEQLRNASPAYHIQLLATTELLRRLRAIADTDAVRTIANNEFSKIITATHSLTTAANNIATASALDSLQSATRGAFDSLLAKYRKRRPNYAESTLTVIAASRSNGSSRIRDAAVAKPSREVAQAADLQALDSILNDLHVETTDESIDTQTVPAPFTLSLNLPDAKPEPLRPAVKAIKQSTDEIKYRPNTGQLSGTLGPNGGLILFQNIANIRQRNAK